MKTTLVSCVLITDVGGVRDSMYLTRTRALAEALMRLSPRVVLRSCEEATALFVDLTHEQAKFTRSSTPSKGYQELLSKLRIKLEVLARRFGFEVRVAFASSATMAFVTARGWLRSSALPAGGGSLGALPSVSSNVSVDILFDFWDVFRKECEAVRILSLQKIKHAIGALKRLGVRSLNEFLRLPQSSLVSRFGKEVFLLSLKIRSQERLDPPWPLFECDPRIEEAEVFDDCGIPISYDVLESLVFVLKRLIDRMSARLWSRSERLQLLQVQLGFLSREVRSFQIGFPLGQSEPSVILRLIRERLDLEIQRHPCPAPISSLKIIVIESVRGRNAQADFLRSKSEDHQEKLETTLGRLLMKLGGEKVFKLRCVERHVPEEAVARESVAVLDSKHSGSQSQSEGLSVWRVPPRPSRLLSNPIPLQSLDGRVFEQGGGRSWRVRDWVGPERIDGEGWWRQSQQIGILRDYFRVNTESGERLWVYRENHSPRFFLQGYFD